MLGAETIAVRIAEVAPNRGKYEHRSMDYINDPSTILADIQKLLLLMEDHMVKRLAEGAAGNK
jgi:hypothetical protein